MPPLFPEHPLPAITACERTTATELQTRGALEAEHSIQRPIEQFPAETIGIEVLNRSAGTVGDNLMSIAPSDAIYGFKTCVVLDSLDKFNDGLFAFTTHDAIYFTAFTQDVLIGV